MLRKPSQIGLRIIVAPIIAGISMGSVANDISSVYVDSIRNASENITSLCQTFAGVSNCSADQIRAGIILGNEKQMENTQKELCAEVKAGAPEADVVEKAGFVVGTKLNCPVQSQGIKM